METLQSEKKFVDWHAHILPGIDDGSKNIRESLLLLAALSLQGVETVIATPHYFPEKESVESFLLRRKKAYDELSVYLNEDMPKVLCGAEVSYYRGISHMPSFHKLTIENSKLLLLEMPMEKWSSSVLKELAEMSGMGDVRIILAHVERYFPYQSISVFEELAQMGLILQANANSFSRFPLRRKLISMSANGTVRLIGSDCHNMTSRPPHLEEAINTVERKLGQGFINDYMRYCSSLFRNKEAYV